MLEKADRLGAGAGVSLDGVMGLAAAVCAASFVFGFALLLGPLAGYADPALTPAQALAELARVRDWVALWNAVIYVLFGVSLVFLSLALYRRAAHLASLWPQVLLSFGLIWAAHAIAAGMLANVANARVLDLAPVDPALAQGLWLASHTAKLGLGGSNEVVGGLWLVAAATSARRVGLMGHWAAALGLLAGASGCTTMLLPGQVAEVLFGLGSIAWFAVLAVCSARVRAARTNL